MPYPSSMLLMGTTRGSRSLSSEDTSPSLYYYHPSVLLAVVGAIAFAVVLAIYLWRFTQSQAWYFWAMYIGLLLELTGFGARVLSVVNPTHASPFVISYIALISGPTFIAAACYATFGRILWYVTPPESHNLRTLWCSARFVTPLFIAFDLGSFFVQLLGAGAVGTAYTSKTLSAEVRQSKTRTGLAALKLGFALQLICFSLFMFIGTRFLYISRRWVSKPLFDSAPKGGNWTTLNWTVNLAAAAITVRAIYRMVEFSSSGSSPSYLVRTEWPFWVFDALPMLGIFILFAIVYPGQHLPREFLSWYLRSRQLRNKAQSSPPTYNYATAGYASGLVPRSV